MKLLVKCLAAGLGLLMLSSAQAEDKRILLENSFAWTLYNKLKAFQIEHPGERPTNWAQIVPLYNRDYLAGMQSGFLEYGEHAGFTNSILEKYVFLPPGVKVDEYPPSEAVMISSLSFPNQSGKPVRMVISMVNTNTPHFLPLAEEKVQAMLTEAGITLPAPEPMPPVTPTIDLDEVRRALLQAEQEYRREQREQRRQPRVAPTPRERIGNVGGGRTQQEGTPNRPTVAPPLPGGKATSTPWLAIVGLLLTGGLLVFLLWRGSRSKPKGP